MARLISPLLGCFSSNLCLPTLISVYSAWHYDNTSIPTNTHPFFSVAAILSISPPTSDHVIYCCGNFTRIRPGYEDILTSLGVKLYHITGHNAADYKLASFGREWLENHSCGHINIISGDGGFIRTVQDAHDRGFSTQVAFTKRCNADLFSLSSKTPVNFNSRVRQVMQQPKTCKDFAHWIKRYRGGIGGEQDLTSRPRYPHQSGGYG